MTEYTVRVPAAICGDVILLSNVSVAMAIHAATGYGRLSLHEPSFKNRLPKSVALLVEAACNGQLKVCDSDGRIRPVKEIVEAASISLAEVGGDENMRRIHSLYVKSHHLIEWGKANGDVFNIIDVPVKEVNFGPKNEHGEYLHRGLFVDADEQGAGSTDVQAKAKIGTNKKTWDDARLRALLNESILPGVTKKSLAEKNDVSRQRIDVLLAKAQEKFKVRNSWTNPTSTSKPKLVKGKY